MIELQIGSWSWLQLVFDMVAILLVATLAYLVSMGFSRFVRRVRAGRGPWRSAVLRLSPFVLFAIFTGLLLSVAYIVFDASHNLFFLLLVVFLVVLGIASTGVFRNVIAGILIGLQRRFHVGDRVRVQGYEGDISRVGLLSVLVKVDAGTTLEIPNQRFISEVVEKASNPDSGAPVDVDFPVPAGVDVQAARGVAFLAAIASKYASPRVRPKVTVELQDRETLTLKVRAYVFEARYAKRLQTEILELLYERFVEGK